MTDKKAKKIPWGWVILFAIVVLYFFAAYMRERDVGQEARPAPSQSKVPAALQDALTPEAKKAASQEHTEGLSYESPRDSSPLTAIEDLPSNPVTKEDKSLKEPPTQVEPKAVIAPVEPGNSGTQQQVPGEQSFKRGSLPSWVALSSWTVAVGVFNESQNAQRLVQQLREKHLPAYAIQENLASGTTLTHVYVGPVLERQQAERLRDQVQKQATLKGTVIAYEPVLQASLQGN